MGNHALLGPSSSKRWINCPGSARATEPIPETYSAYAEEGTLAHEIAELLLQKAIKAITPQKCTGQMKKLRKNAWYSVEMEDYCKEYVEYILDLGEGDTYAEYTVDYSKYVPKGFGTADGVKVMEPTLHVIDLKYGKGVPVEAEGNTQLMFYALGALLEFDGLYLIEEVVVHIYQPRIADGITSITYTKAELIAFGESVVDQAKKAWDGVPEFKSGDWCMFCKMRGSCSTRLEEEVVAVFDTKLDDPGDVVELKPSEMSDAEILHWLPHADKIIKFMNDLKDYSRDQALQGRAFEGFKLVEGKSNRVYMDEELVCFSLEGANVSKDLYMTPRKLLGITALKKNIGTKMFKEVIDPMLVKPPGKPALVIESDKRKAISTATEVFKDE